jgi:hypothetical protein
MSKTKTKPPTSRPKTSAPNIVEFVTDPQLLGLSISPAQETLLRGIYGLPLVSQEQRDIWQLCTEREYPGHPFSEVTVISGARGGKDSRIAAPIVLHEAIFGAHERRVAKGERGVIPLVAQDARAVKVAFGYIRDYLTASPILAALVDGDPLASEITLTNGLSIMCFPCTLRSMRGFSIPAAVMDEVAFFRLEGQADSDVEIQTSIRRGMIGFDMTRLVKISTPYMRSGVLHDDFARAFGKPDPDLLVWRATSALMNPKLTDARLSREQRLDPQRFAREYLAEFADDVMAFLPQAWIDAAIQHGRHELPYREGITYTLAVDPNGGGADAFTCTVVHTEGTGADLRVVQDLVKGWGARRSHTIDLEGVVAEIAQIGSRYKARTVYGDRFSRDWVAQAFQRHHLRYDADHRLDKSAAYLETEPLFAQGRIQILDDPTQRRELVCLERRPRPGNRATVDHPTSVGAHDDYANALALAAAIASKDLKKIFEGYSYTPTPQGPPQPGPWPPADQQPFYWTHTACGTQRLVDPAAETEPYWCLRCEPRWRWGPTGPVGPPGLY